MTWNYDVKAAPKRVPLLITHLARYDGSRSVSVGKWFGAGSWGGVPLDCRVIAWAPMPDPAPLSEDHAQEEGE